MKITTYDTESHERCSVEVPLRRLALSTDLKEAASWRKLLELVGYLHSQGTQHELSALILVRELILSIPEPPDPARLQAMKEWHESNPVSHVQEMIHELQKKFPWKATTSVKVSIDWVYWVPLQDRLSEVRYRVEVRDPAKQLPKNIRAKTPTEAEQLIRRAFRW